LGQDARGIDVGELSNDPALPPEHLRRLAYQRNGRLVQVGVDHDQRVQTTLGRSPSRHTERLDTAGVVEVLLVLVSDLDSHGGAWLHHVIYYSEGTHRMLVELGRMFVDADWVQIS
jgi:hypothetical protein